MAIPIIVTGSVKKYAGNYLGISQAGSVPVVGISREIHLSKRVTRSLAPRFQARGSSATANIFRDEG